jgi:SLT domain-containing protein
MPVRGRCRYERDREELRARERLRHLDRHLAAVQHAKTHLANRERVEEDNDRKKAEQSLARRAAADDGRRMAAEGKAQWEKEEGAREAARQALVAAADVERARRVAELTIETKAKYEDVPFSPWRVSCKAYAEDQMTDDDDGVP